jgi:mono/diheme cytochrome c family protein
VSVSKTIGLPDNPAEDQIRTGERFYYSALNCYQNWLSCSSCHDEGRMDTLNWDLQNDGTGNPKQTKSHVFSSETPPTNVSGCRENALVSARAGYQFIQFQAAPEDRVQATYAFIKSLQPEPSPYLGPDGKLTPDAVEGKKLFEGVAGCSGCHSGTYFTDMQKHDVGTRRSGTEGPDNNPTWDTAGWDTPTLIEAWRTAPYLHLGTAVTVRDVMTTENKKKIHGNAADFSAQQIDQLAAYVMQIGPTRESSAPTPDAGGLTDSALPDSPSPASGGTGGSTTSPTSSGGSDGSSTSANAKGGSGGGSTSSTGGGGSVAPAATPSSCVCNLGAHGESGALSTVVIIMFFGMWLRRGPRQRA